MRYAVSLKKHNTYRVGGEAKFFYEAHDRPSLERAVLVAQTDSVPYYILGGGTNVLVSDKGFDGLAVKMMMSRVDMAGETMRAEAGVPMGVLVNKAKALGLSGLEWAAGLPGTLGGAIYGNAGSCGGETADAVEMIEAFDPAGGRTKQYRKHECDFRYRHSVFKSKNEVILNATLRLKKSDPESVMKKMVENIKFRAEHQPLAGRSEGCVFKNIELVHSPAAARLVSYEGEFARFKKADFLPAGFLIDRAGFKGLRIGGAMVSEKHGNFILNHENATEEDISWIIKTIKDGILKKYGVALEEELRFVGTM